jgi:hypothetical protein
MDSKRVYSELADHALVDIGYARPLFDVSRFGFVLVMDCLMVA